MAKSRLEQLLALIEPRVRESVAGVSFEFGEPRAAQHSAPPRVAWFRAEDGTSVGPARTTARFDASLLDRTAAVVAVCWAARGGEFESDDAALEALVDVLEQSLRDALGSALVLPMSEMWTTEGWIQRGKTARVLFSVRMPVAPVAPAVVGTGSVPIDVGFDDDTSSDSDGVLDAKED